MPHVSYMELKSNKEKVSCVALSLKLEAKVLGLLGDRQRRELTLVYEKLCKDKWGGDKTEMQSNNSRMLTTTEVAHLLHVHPNSVRHWANKGLLPVYRLGPRGDRRFKWKEVEDFIKGNSHKPQQPEG